MPYQISLIGLVCFVLLLCLCGWLTPSGQKLYKDQNEIDRLNEEKRKNEPKYARHVI